MGRKEKFRRAILNLLAGKEIKIIDISEFKEMGDSIIQYRDTIESQKGVIDSIKEMTISQKFFVPQGLSKDDFVNYKNVRTVDARDELAAFLVKQEFLTYEYLMGTEFNKPTLTIRATINVKK